jgi:hypothetical protein
MLEMMMKNNKDEDGFENSYDDEHSGNEMSDLF